MIDIPPAAGGNGSGAPEGRCYLYVFPCTWEDHCKIGFSRDPLSRMQALHHRYFEFFDLDGGWLVETETERDARDLELHLHHQFAEHSAPAPLTVRHAAGGHTEWFRGVEAWLPDIIDQLRLRGYTVHAPLRPWMRRALLQRADLLFAWSLAQLSDALAQVDALDTGGMDTDGMASSGGQTLITRTQPMCDTIGPQPHRLVRDALDACVAMQIDVEPLLPPGIAQWYFQMQ